MIVISQSLVLSAPETYRPNNPLIGWHNLVTAANVSAGTEAAGYPISNVANPITTPQARWQAANTTAQAVTVDVNSVEPIDYLAIARHNLGTAGIAATVEGSIDGGTTWSELVQEFLLPDDAPALFRFSPQALTHIRLALGVGSVAAQIAVLYVGTLLTLQRRIYVGFTPINYGRSTKIVNGKSEAGDFLGRIVTSEQVSTAVDLSNVTPTWYRAQMDPFIVASKKAPFFFAWRPGDYEREVGFVWMTNDPQPSNSAQQWHDADTAANDGNCAVTRVLNYIEIDVGFCALRYGETTGAGTCPAVLGVDSAIKCFNTVKTCAVRPSYLDAPVTLRFAQDVGFLPPDIDAIPSITGISFTPATVSLGKDLGTRASLSVSFKDHPWPDTSEGYDKYLSERGWDAYRRGTFWGKFRARQPFLRGRPMRLIRGTLGQSLAAMETRHFVIDSFSHDAAKGTYTITAKDPLKFADDDRAQAPRLSNGFLNSAITATDITATMQPVGIGNAEYPASGYVAIGGKEICAFSRDVTAGNDANTKLLLHFDGVDAATTFTDSASSPKTVTVNGNAQIDTVQKRFGLASGLFDGSGDYLTYADHADWTPSGNFTFDLQARWNALAGTQYLFTHYTNVSNRYFLSVSSAGALTFSVISGGSTIVTMTSANAVVAADGTWRHIAVVRNGNAWAIYVNGASVATATDSDAVPDFTTFFLIGADHTGGSSFNGWLDEFRFSHAARWTAAFTPSISPYQTSSDILTLTRAQLATAAIAHDASDRVQLVLRYEAVDAADIIRDLLVNYAGVPDGYIPLGNWQAETGNFLTRLFSADIAEPTGVSKLVSELIEDAALSIWWDDVTPQLRLRVLRAVATDAARFDQDNYLEGTFSSREQPNERLSQIWRYFAKRNPLEGQDDPDNYRSVAAEVDLQAETDYGSSVIHKIYSRWIPFGGRFIADKANELHLSRFRDPPRRFNFATFRNEITVPQLGQGYRIAGMGIQDETGAPIDVPIQITRLKPDDARYEIEAEEMLVGEAIDLNNRVIAIDVNTLNVHLRTLHDTLYPPPTDDDVTAGVTLKCFVDAGVIVGSSDATVPSFIVGDWPVGFPITLILAGRVQGAGGMGGRRVNIYDGQQGGTALYTRFPIDLEVGAGEIFGGGGGGGAGSLYVTTGVVTPSSGGGGGAGSLPGAGGGPIPEGEFGSAGTLIAGGAGGAVTYQGGAGGCPGAAGSAGQSGGPSGGPGAGGAAGHAIDGVSYITVTVGPGDIRGPQIN